MNNGKKLAVIILNWNGLDLLREFLPVAAACTVSEEADLIVADNGSTDGSPDWVEESFPEVKLLRFDRNYGFAEGYNKAISQTLYPFTILLNSDVEVKPGWWQPLLRFIESHEDVGAVQPKIKSYHRREFFEYAGAAGGYLDKFGYPYCRGRVFDKVEKDEGQYDGSPADVCWASGAAMTVRTDLYMELGGLDGRFFAHMEEIDLCCRMLAAGYRVCAITDTEVYHVGGASLNQGNPRKTYLNFRNNLLLLYKNLPERGKRRKLIVRRLVDTLAFFMFLAKLDFGNAKAVVKAHRDFKRMKRDYTAEEISRNEAGKRPFPGSHRNIIRERWLKIPRK